MRKEQPETQRSQRDRRNGEMDGIPNPGHLEIHSKGPARGVGGFLLLNDMT